MNRTPFLTLAVVLMSFAGVLAQDAEQVTPLRTGDVLTDPDPAGFAPVGISITEASAEARDNADRAGFSEIYFAKSDILELLKSSKAVGVRFYNAIDNTSTGVVNLVAVAVRSDGSEINPIFSKSYLLSEPLSGQRMTAQPISGGVAKKCVQNACATSALVPFTAFFTRSTLNELLTADALGIKLVPGSRKFTVKAADGSTSVRSYNTMMAIGMTSGGKSLSPIGTQFRKSLQPCPYHCPSDKYLLVPARF